MDDNYFMKRCIELAGLGRGNVAPNPLVGAVLVYKGKIIGEGFHQKYGGPHAEVNCINSVPESKRPLIAKSTMYVSLEPCSHFGKTPPCANLIVEKQIPEVVIGSGDINKKVSGRGIAILEGAGIKVRMSEMEKECHFLNRRFFTFHQFQRPYIILKWAQTMNGVLGNHSQRLIISNAYTNILVHQWRSDEAAILVGHQTAIKDDPLLTNRSGAGSQPLRVILCNKDIPEHLKMFDQPGKTILFNTVKEEQGEKVIYKKVEEKDYLRQVLSFLHANGILSVMVEGGSFTLQKFFDAGIWDECRIITNTQKISDGDVLAPRLREMRKVSEMEVEGDLIQSFVNPQNPFVG